MEGWVPDSMRYVPGRRVAHAGRSVVAPAATSVENDCTRGPCGGASTPGPPAIGHVVAPCALEWSGLGVVVAELPRPPPSGPTIVMEVGTVRLLVRLMVSPPVAPVGTVMTTGDHP